MVINKKWKRKKREREKEIIFIFKILENDDTIIIGEKKYFLEQFWVDKC